MQNKVKNKVSSRRIKKRYFFGAVLMAALSSSSVIMAYRVTVYMSMDDFCIEPFAGKDRIISTIVRIKKDYRYDLLFTCNVLDQDGKIKSSHSLADQLPYSYGRSYYKAGDVLPYTFTLKKEWFSKGDATELSFYWRYEEFERPSPDTYELFLDSVTTGSITPQVINSKMLPFRRDREKTFATYFLGNGFFSERRYYTFDGKGFQDEYVSNHYGIVPLKEMRFTPSYYSQFSDKISMSSGELQVYNYLDDFDIGEIKVDPIKKRKYRSIPLELAYEKDYAYLRSKDTFYVRKDLRYQTSQSHKGEEGWFETKQIFMPPVKGFENRTYSFRIDMYDTGECNLDQFIHTFKVIRTANAYGTKYNSDFFVKEVLNA